MNIILYKWNIIITNKEGKHYGVQTSSTIELLSGADIISEQEKPKLSLNNISTITINDQPIYLENLKDEYLQVPFNALVMLKGIEIALQKQYCSEGICKNESESDAVGRLNSFFATYLQSKEVETHTELVAKLQAESQAKMNSTVDDLIELFGKSDISPEKVISEITAKSLELATQTNIFNLGRRIDQLVDGIIASSLLSSEKELLLSQLNDNLETASHNYMQNKLKNTEFGTSLISSQILAASKKRNAQILQANRKGGSNKLTIAKKH